MSPSQYGNEFRRPTPGRRGKLNDDVRDRVCKLLAEGVTIGVACQSVNIDYGTWYNWLERGRRQRALIQAGHEPDDYELPYLEFLDGVEAAEADGTRYLLTNILRAAKEDWRAAAWILERRKSKEFALKVKEAEAIMELEDERARQIIDSVAVTSNNGHKALTNGHS